MADPLLSGSSAGAHTCHAECPCHTGGRPREAFAGMPQISGVPIGKSGTHDALVAQRNRLQRLFNRLEATISHHKKVHDSGQFFTDVPDEALWAARDRILKDMSEGKG